MGEVASVGDEKGWVGGLREGNRGQQEKGHGQGRDCKTLGAVTSLFL